MFQNNKYTISCIHPLEQLASWYSVIRLPDRFQPHTTRHTCSTYHCQIFCCNYPRIDSLRELCNDSYYYKHVKNSDL